MASDPARSTGGSRQPRVLAWALTSLALAGTSFGAPAGRQSGTTPLRSSLNSAAVGYRYYVTSQSFATNQTLTACVPGFHMASFWEIRDPSNLTYAAERPEAKKLVDSGLGPPSDWYGWVRTGGDSSGSAVAGTGNCLTWSSVNASDFGVAVRLRRSWETPPQEIGGLWDATSFACSIYGPVWCMSDLPTGIFFDGFESAGTSFWSTTVP